jgi:hypothetical protein
MLSILLATIAIAPVQGPNLQQWGTRIEIPGYRPTFVSNGLAGGKLTMVAIADSGFRGYRPIQCQYLIHLPFVKVARGLCTDMTAEQEVDKSSDELLSRRGAIITHKVLADRCIDAMAMRGRPVVHTSGRSKSYDFADEDTYTRVTVTERPLAVGPLPRAWPVQALHAASIPSSFAGIPGASLSKTPDSWARGETQVGAMQYWMTWFVHEDSSTLIPKLTASLTKSGVWNSRVSGGRGSRRFEPVDRKGQFVFLILSSDRTSSMEVPERGWSKVEVSWVDPATTHRFGQ